MQPPWCRPSVAISTRNHDADSRGVTRGDRLPTGRTIRLPTVSSTFVRSVPRRVDRCRVSVLVAVPLLALAPPRVLLLRAALWHTPCSEGGACVDSQRGRFVEPMIAGEKEYGRIEYERNTNESLKVEQGTLKHQTWCQSPFPVAAADGACGCPPSTNHAMSCA